MNTPQTLTAHVALALPPLLHGRQPAGSWHMGRGHAVHLRGKEAAVLRITGGRIWATFDGPHSGPANNLGDLVLAAGEQLTVPAGQGLVIEPWGRAAQDTAFFSWDPLPAACADTAQNTAQNTAHVATLSRLQLAVGDPLRELGLALWLVAQALGHLAAGVAGLGEFLVAGRGRVLPRMESNPP